MSVSVCWAVSGKAVLLMFEAGAEHERGPRPSPVGVAVTACSW